MIFFDGEIYENDMCDKLLARFEDRIATLSETVGFLLNRSCLPPKKSALI